MNVGNGEVGLSLDNDGGERFADRHGLGPGLVPGDLSQIYAGEGEVILVGYCFQADIDLDVPDDTVPGRIDSILAVSW